MARAVGSVIYLWVVLAVSVGGCARSIFERSAVRLIEAGSDNGAYREGISAGEANMLYQRVLDQCVDEGGLIDYEKLATGTETRDCLEGYLAFLGAASAQGYPELFEAGQARTAFCLNAHNACTLRAVLEFYPFKKLSECPVDFFKGVKFVIASEQLSLAEIAGRCTEQEDMRISIALAEPTRRGRALAKEVYVAERLDEQLVEAVKDYLGSCRGLQLDVREQRVLFGRAIWERREDFLDWYAQEYGIRVGLVSAMVPWGRQRTQEQLVDWAGFQAGELKANDYLNDVKNEEVNTQEQENSQFYLCGSR